MGHPVTHNAMKMKYAVLSLVLLAALVGCNTKPSLVGTWTGTMAVPQQGEVPATITFNTDKTYRVEFATGAGLTLAETGTYTDEEGTKVLLTTGEIKLEGDLPPAVAPYKAQMDAAFADAKGGTRELTYKFKDADTVDVKYADNSSATFTRKKE